MSVLPTVWHSWRFIQACQHTDQWAEQNTQLIAERDERIEKLLAWQSWWDEYDAPEDGAEDTAQAEHFEIHSNNGPSAEEQRQAKDAALYAQAAAAKAQGKAQGPPIGGAPSFAASAKAGQAGVPPKSHMPPVGTSPPLIFGAANPPISAAYLLRVLAEVCLHR